MPLNELTRKLNAMELVATDLAGKEQEAKAVLGAVLESAGAESVAVAWTGGKDSTLVMRLWLEVLRAHGVTGAPLAISIDTGCKFPEVMAFRDTMAAGWGVDVHVARPEVDLESYPVAEDKLKCCNDLKVQPLLKAVCEKQVRVLLTGIRADEHETRQGRPMAEGHDNPDHLRVHPILEFTEMDVWSYSMDRGLPMNSMYAQGYRSLGCVPCTSLAGADGAERAGRDADKEAQLDQLRSLGYF